MSTHTIRQRPPAAKTDADPATAAHQKLLERQRARARRTLLKRRQAKSGQ